MTCTFIVLQNTPLYIIAWSLSLYSILAKRKTVKQYGSKNGLYFPFQTYIELLDMSEYDAAKYLKVEDIPVEGKRKRMSGKKSRSLRHKPIAPPRIKKWSSVQNIRNVQSPME